MEEWIMLTPSIFGENLFDDDWMNFPFDQIENAFWGKSNPLYGKHAKNMMKTDIREHDEGYEVDIDLPGFKKDEIQVELDNGYLTISASKGLNKDEKDKKGKFIRKERYAGAMQRSFYVGEGITHEDIKAKYENGILSLSIPKKEAKAIETNKTIAIEG
jgi:HSP20 family protein